MALRDYLPSFLRGEAEQTKDMLGELTPAERVRLNAPPDNVDRAERMAERMSDATDPMHDKMRERQADNYRPDRDGVRQIANGWTEREAEAMNRHMDAKATREWERSEPDHASVRKAERMADAIDPMHDAAREAQADAYYASVRAKEARQERAVNEPYYRERMAAATDPMHDERRERQADNYKSRASQQENDIMSTTQKQDGLTALDGKSRELVAAAANAIEKVNWFYDRSPDPEVLRDGFKHMRAAIHSLDAVVTHGGNIRAEYAIDAVDAVKQHTLRTEAASAIWQHHAPKMASETKEYYRPDWFYSEKLHANSWDMEKISAMGREHQSARVGASQPGVNSMDSEVKAAKRHVREREQERWNRVEQIGRQAIETDRARVTEKQTATTKADEETERPRPRMTP